MSHLRAWWSWRRRRPTFDTAPDWSSRYALWMLDRPPRWR